MQIDFTKHFIDGQWVASSTTDRIDVENPATQSVFACVSDGTREDVDRAVNAAEKAFKSFKRVSLEERIALIERVLAYLESQREAVAILQVKELGAPMWFAQSNHTDRQFERIRTFIDAAKALPLSETYPLSTVVREPVGVVACITPWNYPLGQIIQKAVPAILMGNTVVVKPSQYTPLSAFLLAKAFEEAQCPPGVFNLVCGRGENIGSYLAAHPKVDMLSFTGSTLTGKTLASVAIGTVKRLSLELGGKSAFILLPGYEHPDLAVDKLFASIFHNSGQTCTSLSRLLVPRHCLKAVEKLLKQKAALLKTGDPHDPTVRLGPLVSRDHYNMVCRYIALGMQEGARLLTGGMPAQENIGYWIEPTIFSDVKPQMRIAREEIFGPVLCVIPYDTITEAIDIANGTIYGLSAAVWGPKMLAKMVAGQLRSGNVYINDAPRDPAAPFGGMKQSGIGRESGPYGLLEFTQLKAVFDHNTF